ncbi:MAG: HTTM domain-containing protein [Thermoleophilaceae bacterium]
MATTVPPAPAAAHGARWLRRVDEALGRPVSMRAMALLRVLVGPIVLLHLRPLIEDARRGRLPRDVFNEPYVSWYPELPRAAYVAMLWIAVVAAVAMTIGLCARLATVTVWLIVTYDLFLSTTNVHNNRAYLVIVLAALAVTPCGRELSVDAWWRSRRGLPARPTVSPAWPLWLLRFEASIVYGASGLSKLLDRDWASGTVTWHRVVLQRSRLESSALPGWSIEVLTNRSFHTFAAKVIIATELFIALGLWGRTRNVAIWVAVCFHVTIQLTASVEVFSYLAIAALVIWSVPSTRDRLLVVDPGRPAHRRLVRTVGALDWLARFRVEHGEPGAPLRVVDRDGRVLGGSRATRFALSRLPITAWFALPTLIPVGPGRRPTTTTEEIS